MDSFVVQDRARQRWIIFSTCFASFMCVLDGYIVNISLPAIAHSFNTGTGMVARIVIVYLLILTSTIPVFGKLGDRFGFTRVLIGGFAVFTLGSLLCGVSTSIGMLILARCLQALGGAVLYAIPPAAVPRFLPADMRGTAFGALSTTAALGVSLGAPVGGLISTYLSWNFIFLVNVPIGIAAVLMIKKHFPRDHGLSRSSRCFDIPGAVLCFIGLSALLYCLNNGQEMGWTSHHIIICAAASAASLISFVLWERKCEDPLIDFSLFRNRDFTLANTANFFQYMFMTGNTFLIPFYLILVKNLKADVAGVMMLAQSLTMMAVGPLAGKASDRVPPRLLCIAGSSLAFLGSFFFSQTLGAAGLWQTIAFLIMNGVAFGLFIPPNSNHIMNEAPEEHHGAASALLKTITNMGSAFGICIFETVFTLHIPDDIVKGGQSLMGSHVSPGILMSGLQASYLCGCLFCLLSLLFTFMTGHRRSRQPAAGAGIHQKPA